jgi:hypothetical protein
MANDPDAPLGPPPRKAHVRRGARNVRGAYAMLFLLVIVVFGGWAALDILHGDHNLVTGGFVVVALLTVVVYQFVDHPLRRELRLARRGEAVQAQLVSVGRKRNRRGTPFVGYTFQTPAGALVEGHSTLPRRFPVETLAPGMTIEVLYDPKKPKLNKPRLALEYVEFGALLKKTV